MPRKQKPTPAPTPNNPHAMNMPPMEFVVDKIYPAFEFHLVGGASGVGKTTFESQIIEAWRKGEEIFGYTSHPCPFAYIACDRSLESIYATLQRLGIDPKEWPIISLVHTKLPRSLPLIIQWAKKMQPDLEMLWVDGIQSLVPGGKINDYKAVCDWLVDITTICHEDGLTIKGIGHTAKVKVGENFPDPRQRILGSAAFAGYTDTIMVLDRAKPECPTDPRRLVHVLPRHAPEQTLYYELDKDGRYVPTSAPAEDDPSALDLWLRNLPPDTEFSTQDVLTEATFTDISRRTVERWLTKQKRDGLIDRLGKGTYRVRNNN